MTPSWKNRPKYGLDQATELEIALRVLREERERIERERPTKEGHLSVSKPSSAGAKGS